MCVFVKQSYPTLCDPMGCSLPGSSVHEILRQKYWSGLPFPSPGDLPNPRIKPRSPALQADSSPSEPPEKPYNIVRLTIILMPYFGPLKKLYICITGTLYIMPSEISQIHKRPIFHDLTYIWTLI